MTLLDAIEEHGFDAAFGGARRDEERARAKERDPSLPRRLRPVGPEGPAPRAVERSTTGASSRASTCACSRSRTGPSSTSGSTSPRSSSSCRRSTSRTSARCSSATGCSTPCSRLRGAAATARSRSRSAVRYRTVGDMSCTGAVALDGDDAAGRGGRDRRHADHRARRDARRRPRHRGGDGRPQEGGLLLDGHSRRGHQRQAARRRRTSELVRFATAGSVDDGKSTLIGRLLLRLQVDLRGPARARRGDVASGAATAT